MFTVDNKGAHANLTNSEEACIAALQTQGPKLPTKNVLKLKLFRLKAVYGA